MPNPKGKHLMNGSETNKGQGLENNKQNINKNGRPRKGISLVNQQLKEKGYHPATKQDIEVNYMSLMGMEESALIELGKDKSQPMLIRILIKNMLSGKGFDVIEKMLDRGIGKTTIKDDDGNDKHEFVIVHKHD